MNLKSIQVNRIPNKTPSIIPVINAFNINNIISTPLLIIINLKIKSSIVTNLYINYYTTCYFKSQHFIVNFPLIINARIYTMIHIMIFK